MSQPSDIEQPLVSVCIITYNQKKFLRECIESVLAQDYPNIEIIVGDDASTDGTQEMLREFETTYPDKFVLRLAKINMGITCNSNAVFFSCSGKYVAMLGGDDLMLPGRITKQVNFLETDLNYTLCGTYTKLINAEGKEIGVTKDYRGKKNPTYTLYDQIESGNSLVPVVSYMFRRSAAPAEGFDNRLPVASDALFINHVASKGGIFILREVLTAYRVHESHARRIGYVADALVVNALNEFYYPDYFKAIYSGKSGLSRSIGIGHILKGDYEKGICYFRISLRCKFSMMTLLLLISTKTRFASAFLAFAEKMRKVGLFNEIWHKVR
jgi:glycosyltransferase involved in cell wall biosynthesis